MNRKSFFQGKRKSKNYLRQLISILLILAFTATGTVTVNNAPNAGASSLSVILLSKYSQTLRVNQSFYLIGIATNGKRVTWKSSSSKIASVNTYGLVTGKKAGTCKITAKVSGAEASCLVTVLKTEIRLTAKTVTMENGASFSLRGTVSSGSPLTWKSSKRSVATIDDKGLIEAVKPGETTITASADGTKATCKVTVKKPKVTLNKTTAALYRKQTVKLTANVSSGRAPIWKSQKSSVATVDERGLVTARKHGTAWISASVDGVTRVCEVTVRPPEISLNKTAATLKKGKSLTLTARVSSGAAPAWKSSKTSVASVSQKGVVTAHKKGTCYISASEDGTTESCKITVTG